MASSNPEISRRDFLYQGVTASFALAVLPTAAWAVATSGEGLEAGPVRIPTNDGEIPGYRAMPKGKGPYPVILVVHEIFGVHEHIQDVCRRFAKQGYVAVAPYLYSRQGDVTNIQDFKKIFADVVSRVPQAQVLADLDATVAWIEKTKEGDTKKLGITGFCWGGTIVWLYCAHSSRVKAGVSWYGKLNADRTALQPNRPIDVAGELKAPVLGLYGGKDQSIPSSDVEAMTTALKKSKTNSKIIVYPDADHGFHADYRPSYNEKSAKDGWDKALAWFAGHH